MIMLQILKEYYELFKERDLILTSTARDYVVPRMPLHPLLLRDHNHHVSMHTCMIVDHVHL